MKPFLKIEIILLVVILLFGLFLRIYKLEARTSFDADQEWMAVRSQELLNGDLALIGPITSVGSFSIGPGFIYLSSVFMYLFNGDPVSIAILSVLLGMMFLFMFHLFFRNFVDVNLSLIVLFMLSVSSELIFWDQNPWTPSLFYLSQTVLLIAAYISLKNKWGYPLLAIGFIMGFQSHLGIVLSLISVFVFYLFARPVKIDRKMLMVTIAIILIGLLPNIVFDLKNNFVNSKRFVEAVKGDDVDYFLGINKVVNTLSYSAVSFVYPRRIDILDSFVIKTFFALVVVNTLRHLRDKKLKNLSILLLCSALIPPILFYLKQSKFSEYYLMMTVPSLLLMTGLFLNDLFKKKILLIIVFIFAVYLNLDIWKNFHRNWSMLAKKQAIEFMISKAGYTDYGLSLTTRHGDQFGFKYLVDYYGVKANLPPLKDQTKIFTIVVPAGYDGIGVHKEIDGIGLIWQGM